MGQAPCEHGVASVFTVKSICFMNNFESLITLQAVRAIKGSSDIRYWDAQTQSPGHCTLALLAPSSYSSSMAADGLGAPASALPMLESAS